MKCSPATCRQCKKTTYSGCGQHVKRALKGVPATDRCRCNHGHPAKKTLFGWGARRQTALEMESG